MKKRIALVLAGILAFSITGCMSDGNGGKIVSEESGEALDTENTVSESESAGKEEAEENGEKMVITYMEWGDEDVLEQAEAQFEKMYPNVDIVIDNCGHVYDDYVNKLKVTMAANEGPEVFKLQPGGLLNQFQDYLLPLNSYLEADFGENWKDEFDPSIYSQIEDEEGNWIGAPTYLSVAGPLFVNESLLEENGLTLPETYEELVECCRVLREKGIAPVAMGAKDDWANQDMIVTLFNQFAPGKVYEVEKGNGKWTDTDMVDALRQWQKYFTDGVFVDGALGLSIYNDALDLFDNGNAGFLFNGHWNMGQYVNAQDSPAREEMAAWSVIPLPPPEGKEPAVQVALSDMICVNRGIEDEAVREMAYKFALFFSSDFMTEFSKKEYVMQTAKNGVELSTTFYGESGPKMEESLKEMVKYNRGPRELSNVETKAELMVVLQEIAMGSLTPEEGAARVQAVADSQ